MFERFTDRARRVVRLAQEEAWRLGHNYIGTEHLLLGLVHEPDTVAGEALASAGVSLEAVRRRVIEIVGEGGGITAGRIPFTPEAKRALERTLNEATRLGDNYIGTAHLLLSVLRQPDGDAAQIVVALGGDLEVLEQLVRIARTENRERVPVGSRSQSSTSRTLTPAAAGVKQAVLALTAAEPVRSYHYLLALFDDSSSVAAKVLASFDIDRATVEQRIAEIGTAGTTDELPQY
jgi:ATP-dependent Clp protease ATP-binding subunit ClpA